MFSSFLLDAHLLIMDLGLRVLFILLPQRAIGRS